MSLVTIVTSLFVLPLFCTIVTVITVPTQVVVGVALACACAADASTSASAPRLLSSARRISARSES